MENDMLQCKDPFPKTVANACCILSSWKNKYSKSNTRLTETNDGVAFATTGTEENKGKKNKLQLQENWPLGKQMYRE